MSMKNRLNTKEITTDVLIIGGGTAGCYAALVLSEQKAGRVLIAEKANIKRSGWDRKTGPSSYSSGELQRSYRKNGKTWTCDPEG